MSCGNYLYILSGLVYLRFQVTLLVIGAVQNVLISKLYVLGGDDFVPASLRDFWVPSDSPQLYKVLRCGVGAKTPVVLK